MTQDWRTPINMDDWMRDIEKRLKRQERRLSSTSGSVVSGEGQEYRVPPPPAFSIGEAPPNEPPLASPTLTTQGDSDGVTIFASGDLARGTYIDYYIDGVKVVTTKDRIVRLTTNSNGAPMSGDPVGTVYQFHTVAKNDLGDADPSPAVQGSLDPGVSETFIRNVVAAGIVMTNAIQVGANGSWDPNNGFKIELDDGGVVHFPADGSSATITADIWARSITALGVVAFRNAINEVAPGAGIYWSKGTTAPASPPTVTSVWGGYNIGVSTNAPSMVDSQWPIGTPWTMFGGSSNAALGNTIYVQGATLADDRIYHLTTYFPDYGSVPDNFMHNVAVIEINPNTGSWNWFKQDLMNHAPYTAEEYWTGMSLAVVAAGSPGAGVAKYAVGGRSETKNASGVWQPAIWYITKYDQNWNYVSNSRFAPTQIDDSSAAIMDYDLTNNQFIIFQGDATNNLDMYKYNSAGTFVSVTDTGVNTTMTDPYVFYDSLTCTAADFGGMRYVLRMQDYNNATGEWVTTDRLYVFNTSGARQTTEEWPLPTGYNRGGPLHWNPRESRWEMPDAGLAKVWKFGKNFWTSSTENTQRISTAWETALGELTTQGPRKSFTAKKRAMIQVQTPQKPPGVTKVAIYAGYGTDTNTRVDMWKQGASSTADTNILDNDLVYSGTNPVAVSTMPDSTPGFGQSDALDSGGVNPMWFFRGNGDWKWGGNEGTALDPVGWQAWGTLTGAAAQWVDGTISYCEYRQVGRQVFVRGAVTLGIAYTNTATNIVNQIVVSGLPTAVRPTRTSDIPARLSDTPAALVMGTAGQMILTGISEIQAWASGASLIWQGAYMLD